MREALDPLTGIMTGLRMISNEPGAPDFFNATVRMTDTTPYFGAPCNPRNGGAGLSEDEAVKAALGEGIERYCAAAIDPSVMVTGSVTELERRGLFPLRPSELALFADSQRDGLPFAFFDEKTPLSWTEGVSLVDQRPRLVPSCLVNIPYRPISDCETTIGPSISTGLACGPDRDSAIISGLYEAIERDAFTIVWRNRLAAPRLFLDEPRTAQIFERHFARPRLNYHLFYIEFDIAVPTIIAIVEDYNFDPPIFCLGGAARLSVTEAVRKALVECAQGWTWARQERLRNGFLKRPQSFDDITEFDARVTLYACADMADALDFLLASDRNVSLMSLAEQSKGCNDPIDHLVCEISRTGSDIIAIELTTRDIADLGLSVVKSVCPQLEQVEGDHRFPLLGGTRWRSIPVETGWRAEPMDIANLNPFPILIREARETDDRHGVQQPHPVSREGNEPRHADVRDVSSKCRHRLVRCGLSAPYF